MKYTTLALTLASILSVGAVSAGTVYQNENGDIAFGDRNVYPRSVIKKMIRI